MTTSSTTGREWWPHDGEPYMLIDTPDEGYVEEVAHVPVRAIEADEFAEVRALGGLQAAALEFIARYERGEPIPPDTCLTLTGERVWQRPLATQTAAGEWLINPTGDEQRDEEVGAGMRSDYCPWEPCAPDAPDAVEFYVLEATER